MLADTDAYSVQLSTRQKLEQLSDRKFSQLYFQVLDYFRSAPPIPPIAAEQQLVRDEVNKLNGTINKLWERYEAITCRTKDGVMHSKQTLNSIEQCMIKKELKESQLQKWAEQNQTYSSWQHDPNTLKMKQVYETMNLPQLQSRLATIEQQQTIEYSKQPKSQNSM